VDLRDIQRRRAFRSKEQKAKVARYRDQLRKRLFSQILQLNQMLKHYPTIEE